MNAADTASVVDRFHAIYYESRVKTWGETYWLGHRVLKCPLDLWIYQELLYDVRPELIIETGTYLGGSALLLASICDLLGRGKVVTIDSARQKGRPRHRRITYLTGSSTSKKILFQVRRRARGRAPILVILDSGHGKAHVLAEMRAYGPFVTPGSYLIVEDTNLNGHPVEPHHGSGPAEAVEGFLAGTDEFVRDEQREKFLLTFNPGGYLMKRSTAASRASASGSLRSRLWRWLRSGRRGRHVLEQHEARLAQRVADGMRALSQLRRLRSLQDGPSVADVVLRHDPAEQVVSVGIAGTESEIPGLLRQAIIDLRAHLAVIGQRAAGPPGGLFPEFDGVGHGDAPVAMEVFLPVDQPALGAGRIATKRLPPATVATIRYIGPYTLLSRCYRALMAWMEEHGHEQDGPLREIYWVGPESGIDPTKYETEVVWPVRIERQAKVSG